MTHNTRPAAPGELDVSAPRLGFPLPPRVPADFASLVNDTWGADSLPTAADVAELAIRYETERPSYAEHGCSVEYTVESLVGDLRSERRESAAGESGASDCGAFPESVFGEVRRNY